MQQIRRINPDVIFSTLVGNSAGAFYQQHHQYALKQHIASSITAETEITAIQPSYTVGLFFQASLTLIRLKTRSINSLSRNIAALTVQIR